MPKSFEDSFIKVAGLIGGPDYILVAKFLCKAENSTDEEIAELTELKINVVRKSLYDLFGRSLITGTRVRDLKRGWFVYRWKAQHDQVEPFVERQKSKATLRLKQRLDYESVNEFYHCGNPTCLKYTFDSAFQVGFKCQLCNLTLNSYDNTDLKKALDSKIDEIITEDNVD